MKNWKKLQNEELHNPLIVGKFHISIYNDTSDMIIKLNYFSCHVLISEEDRPIHNKVYICRDVSMHFRTPYLDAGVHTSSGRTAAKLAILKTNPGPTGNIVRTELHENRSRNICYKPTNTRGLTDLQTVGMTCLRIPKHDNISSLCDLYSGKQNKRAAILTIIWDDPLNVCQIHSSRPTAVDGVSIKTDK
jgi:hypothetical protein